MNRVQLLASLFVRKPPPGVVEWLEANIRLPRQFTRTPGPFSLVGRRFMRAVLECFHPESGVTDCEVAGATQLLKTTVLLLGQAYRMPHNPVSSLIVVPSRDFGRDVISGERLQPLINHNPVLAALKPEDPNGFKALDMAMKGGHISIVGANSPGQLSGRSRGMVLQDEVCKFEVRTSEQSPESHPMLLADERTKDFGPTAFRYKSSSPNSPHHPFWLACEAGDQTTFYVKCPNCPEEFPFEFVKDGNYRSLEWDANAKNKDGLWVEEKVKESARYICRKCGYRISSYEKGGMIERCTEVRLNPTAPPWHRSFHISSFYAPTVTFGEMAWQFLSGMELFGLQNFYNSWLALPWSEISCQIGDDDINALKRTDYRRGQVPKGAQYLTIQADPGEISGVHWMVSAVLPGDEVFAVEWGQCLGIDELLTLPFQLDLREVGTNRKIPIVKGLTDSRYHSTAVYDLCLRSGGFWTPTRGLEIQLGHWTASPVSSHPGLNVYKFSDTNIKTELYGRRIKKKEEPRVWLPADADEPLLRGLSGQQFDSRTNKWKRLQHDHYGDCLKQLILLQWVLRAWQFAGAKMPKF